jgi:predicted AlkP superfamily pyrophosphatase or phosphodiesterase
MLDSSRCRAWIAGFVLVACTAALSPRMAGAAPRSHVVLVSLDGLYPEIYRRSRELGVKVPNLERLVRDGVSADGMRGVFPTATYPSHTTLITGVRPGRHGVVANSVFSPEAEPAWYWYADSLRVTCLPQAAGTAGLSVGVSCWPALVGAPWVRWHLPEIWSLGEKDASSRDKVLHWATPGLVAEVEKRFGDWTSDRFDWGKQDDRITDGAVYLIEAKRPQLLLVHLVEVDHVLHGAGRNAAVALRAFEVADKQIGRLLAALDRAGLRDSTNVVIVGDHGFTNVHTDVRPNVQLVELGLLSEGGGRAGDWRAIARTTTAAAAIYVRDRGDAETATRAQRHFERLAAERYAGIFTVLDRAALDRYGAFPGAAFGLVCEPGYSFSGRDNGAFLAASRSRGMHGYRPEEPSMFAGFIATGPDFQIGLQLPQIRMLDVAPTLAEVLGIDLGPQVEGVVVPGLLRSRSKSGTGAP